MSTVEAEKSFKVIKELEAKKASDIQEEVLSKKVDALLDAKLKSMPAMQEQKSIKVVKSFNHFTKSIESSENISEERKTFAEMLGCLNTKNYQRAKEIVKDLAPEKERQLKSMGMGYDYDVKSALTSDATTGSYLIPTEVEAEIFQRAYQSVMLKYLNTKALAYNDKLYPVFANFDLEFIASEATQIGDKTPTVSNPTVEMQRVGGMNYASNNLLKLKGSQLVNAFIVGFGDALARFIDLYTVAGSVAGNSDGFNGLVFDANTDGTATSVALNALDIADLTDLKNKLDPKFRAGSVFLASSEIRDKYGAVVTTSGDLVFKDFVSNGIIKPYGKEFVENPYIPATFDLATSKRTTGTDRVLICFNGEGVVFGFDNLQIASSEHALFSYDQMAWRGLARMGMKVISGSTSQGVCVAYKKITE